MQVCRDETWEMLENKTQNSFRMPYANFKRNLQEHEVIFVMRQNMHNNCFYSKNKECHTILPCARGILSQNHHFHHSVDIYAKTY